MKHYTWRVTKTKLECRAAAGSLEFWDTRDHWDQGVCRLMGWTSREGQQWVESRLRASRKKFSTLTVTEKIQVLQKQGRLPLPPRDKRWKKSRGPHLESPDQVFATRLFGNPGMQLLGSSRTGTAWLFDPGAKVARVLQAVEYEADYFQGEQKGLGYGDCHEQAAWRLSKAARFWQQIQTALAYYGQSFPERARLLDIGCGFGYFLSIMQQHGWQVLGQEISHYACQVARQQYQLPVQCGAFDQVVKQMKPGLDLITAWDVLEHMPYPGKALTQIYRLLKPGGILALRTPNLNALEWDVFQQAYHSIKREHLVLYTPAGLAAELCNAGFEVVMMDTQTHFFQGFLQTQQSYLRAVQKGADLFVVARKGKDV